MDVPKPEHDLAGQNLNEDNEYIAPVFSRFHNGESIRTDRWRYSEWRDDEGAILFDHQWIPILTV